MADHRTPARGLSALAAAAALALPSLAAGLTVQDADCREGADFIANAARSRDNGLSGEAFKERLEADLVAIRSFAPALRWFARDDEDAQLLRDWVARVFDDGPSPSQAQSAFLAACREEIVLARARHGHDAARGPSAPPGGAAAAPPTPASPEGSPAPGQAGAPRDRRTDASPEDTDPTRI